jgi:YD repeat-containing protein
VSYAYDLLGRMTSAATSAHTLSFSYDALGRLTSTTRAADSATHTLSYQYDAAGRRTRITHPDSAYFSMDYDTLGRPTWLTDPASSALANFVYDTNGHPAAVGRPGATTGTNIGAEGRLSTLSHYFSAGLDAQWSYSHNPAGQIADTARTNDAYAWGGHYAAARAYTTDGLNRYSAAGGASFTYDDNGNLATTPGPGVSETLTFAYDSENRLVQRSSNGASQTVSLAYDPLGRRYSVASGGNTTRFLWDGDDLVAEYDGSNVLQHRYVHGAGIDAPLVHYAGTGTASTDRRNLLADERGSIVAVSDNAGNRLAINRYDEYGIPAGTITYESENLSRCGRRCRT